MRLLCPTLLIALMCTFLSGCSDIDVAGLEGVSSIYWSDGDSGRIEGERFRLANVDAPETGNINSNGGAQCEEERLLGFEAKEFIIQATRNAEVVITSRSAPDRYGRSVVSLSVDGRDLAGLAIEAGYLRPWPHRNGRPASPKPDWCAY